MIGTIKKQRQDYLFPAYYWGFTFFTPLIARVGEHSTLVLFCFALIFFVLCLSTIIKSGSINASVLIGIGFLFLLLIDILARNNTESLNYAYKYIYSGFLTILFVSVIKNPKQVLWIFSIFSIIAFITMFYDPFLDYAIFGDYMGYGFNLALPAFIGIFIGNHYFRKRWLIILELACLAMIFIYANRGAFLAAVVFVMLYYLLMHKKRKIFLGLLVFAVLAFFVLFDYIIDLIVEILIKLDVNTYAIMQIIGFLSQGDFSTFFSGRFTIWNNAWTMFINKPAIGYGVGYFDSIYNTYPHNIVLDVLVSYGIIGLIIVCVLLSMSLYKMIKRKNANRLLGILFLSLWLPKLVFSSSFVWDSGFWAFITFGFIYLINNEQLLEKKKIATDNEIKIIEGIQNGQEAKS